MDRMVINDKADDFISVLHRRLAAPPLILGRERYLNAAVLIPLFRWEGEWHLLFQRRAPHIRQSGEICFPGGRFDPELDQDYAHTAVRETIEEMGIPGKDITVLGHMGTLVSPSGVAVDAVPGVIHISHPKELNVNPHEVAEVIYAPLSFFRNNPPKEYSLRHFVEPVYVNEHNEEVTLFPARELGLPKQYWERRWQNRSSRVFVYLLPGATIWGLTAELIQAFVHLLK